MIINENIEIACSTIEKAAQDRAVAEVDEGFSVAYATRRAHREVSLHDFHSLMF